MKIGILTFHWATNYGAVLQAYALQTHLESHGHEGEIINYKPRQYDENLYKFLRYRKFLNFREYLNTQKREKVLIEFRNSHLNQTERVYTCDTISKIASQFDMIISGSDQVANPSFLMSGEGRGVVSPAYFLGFPYDGKRVGYALSFGCVAYPEEARKVASIYIGTFDHISVREASGVDIVKLMGREDAEVVPDPTLLMDSFFYNSLADECQKHNAVTYVYSFFIRHIVDRKPDINNALKEKTVLWNNEDGDYTIQGWLSKIKHSEFVLTDSFHCVVMCLKLHKPFVVITEKEGNVGMNDRLYTLLGKMNLEKCIVYKKSISSMYNWKREYDWEYIDASLSKIEEFGKDFLIQCL